MTNFRTRHRQIINPASGANITPVAERLISKRLAQQKYASSGRRPPGKRTRVSSETFKQLEQFGACFGAPDSRVSRAGIGLIHILRRLDVPVLIAGLPSPSLPPGRRKKKVERSVHGVTKRVLIESKIREIFLNRKDSIQQRTLCDLVDFIEAGFSYKPVGLRPVRELWVPFKVVDQLTVVAGKLCDTGGVGFVARLRTPSLGDVIDWLVGTEAFQKALEDVQRIAGTGIYRTQSKTVPIHAANDNSAL
jgi:hypothetical protein